MSLKDAINNLKDEMALCGIFPEKGLGTELFLFSSTLAPVVNVDLLITDRNDRILLSWREDKHDKAGWHIPGSCIRFQETIDISIQRCAMSELGSRVYHSQEPIKVYEFHWNKYREGLADQKERAHFITLVYACKLPEGYDLNKNNCPEGIPGHLKWFDNIPDNIVPIQRCYKHDWEILLQQARQVMGEKENEEME